MLEHLYEALNSEHGVIVSTNDPERFRQRFYVERKRDQDLECLSCTLSPTNPNAEVWIVKNGKE